MGGASAPARCGAGPPRSLHRPGLPSGVRFSGGSMLFRLGFFIIACATVAPGLQDPANSPISEREKQVYAIYSLMLTNPNTSHGPDDNERYMIAALTAPGPGNPAPCALPPKDREAVFREVLADYERRKDKPRELKAAFSIRKPYSLLNPDEVKAFMAVAVPTSGAKPRDKSFRGVTDLFMLSDVYFNQRQTLALTAIASWCGGLCALYQWKVFEKSSTGKWEEKPWVKCVTIAGDSRPSRSREPSTMAQRPCECTAYRRQLRVHASRSQPMGTASKISSCVISIPSCASLGCSNSLILAAN